MRTAGRRALLIVPPTGLYRREDRCQSRVEDPTVRVTLPPIHLAYIAASLEARGVRCEVMDCPAEGTKADRLLEYLRASVPDVLVASTTAPTFPKDLQVVKKAKEAAPALEVVLLGNHLSLYGERVLEEEASVDVIVVDAPEFLVAPLLTRGPSEQIPNLMYRDRSGTKRTRVELFLDYDLLPTPARRLLRNELYRIPDTGKPITVLEASRGCRGRCVFCPVARRRGGRVYTRSVPSAMAEIRECVGSFGIETFLFNADNFTAERQWVIEFSKAIVASGLAIRWICNSRVDTVDEEMLMWMKRAGCSNIGFGVESGSQAMLDRMKKGINLAQTREVFRKCRKVGITSHAFFLIGLPWETRESLEETYRFAKTLPADFFDVHIAYPLPNTEFYEICIRDTLFVQPLAASSYASPAIRSYALDAQELEKARKRMLLTLFLRPGYIARTLARARSAGELKNYVLHAARKMRSILS